MEPSDHELVERWLKAAQDPAVRCELDALQEYIAASIESRRPVCTASGRCCNFEQFGHRLYATGLETAYTISQLRERAPLLTATTLSEARDRGGCPFQIQRLCEVHHARPLGCRVYFCDATAQDWQQDLYERVLRELRGIHERHEVEYRYGEWRGMLGMFVG